MIEIDAVRPEIFEAVRLIHILFTQYFRLKFDRCRIDHPHFKERDCIWIEFKGDYKDNYTFLGHMSLNLLPSS